MSQNLPTMLKQASSDFQRETIICTSFEAIEKNYQEMFERYNSLQTQQSPPPGKYESNF